MKIKTTVAAIVLAVAPTFALAMGCNGYKHGTEQAMSCAEGTVWDAATNACVELTTS